MEVLHDRGADHAQPWAVGTGFRVGGRYVLTAAHVVGITGTVTVRVNGTTELSARIATLPNGRPALDVETDLAIVEADLPQACPAVPIARLVDDPMLDTPNLEGCVALGFPEFAEQRRTGRDRPVRDTVRIDGYIPMGEGAVLQRPTLRIRDAPNFPPVPLSDLDSSPWGGISGALVLASGSAIGVITEHHLAAGSNALTIVPLSWIDRIPDSGLWWTLLDVPAPDRLPRLPSVHAAPREAADDILGRFRVLLTRSPELAALSTPFGGLPPDFYLPRMLRAYQRSRRAPQTPGQSAEDGAVQPATEVVRTHERLVLIAPAGMGKTAFLHDIARTLLDAGEQIPLVLRLNEVARRGGDRDLIDLAIEINAGDILGRSERERLSGVLHERMHESGVTFLLDGLDEVPFRQQEEFLVRIRRLPRFILTSRPTGRIEALQEVAPAFRIDELGDGDVVDFVEHWADRDPEVREVFDRLGQDVDLADLVRSPQLLILLCWLGTSDSDLAGRLDRSGLVSHAVGQAFQRAARLSDLPEGDEEIVPRRVRSALRQVALESMLTGDGRRLTFSDEHFGEVLRGIAGGQPEGRLLAFARRTGLIVEPAGLGADVQFLHQVFREHLAGEALAGLADPADSIAALLDRADGDDPLAAAAALDSPRIAELILDRTEHGPTTCSGSTGSRVCDASGVPDPTQLAGRLRELTDEVLAGAREWWSRDQFVPAFGTLRTPYALQTLLSAVADDDAYLRWAAVEGLGRMGGREAVDVLAQRLTDESWPAIQRCIVTALGRLHAVDAVATVLDFYARSARDSGRWVDHHSIGEFLGRVGAVTQLRELTLRLADEPELSQVLVAALPFVTADVEEEVLAACTANRVVSDNLAVINRYLDELDAAADAAAAAAAAAAAGDSDADDGAGGAGDAGVDAARLAQLQEDAIASMGLVGTREAIDKILTVMLLTDDDDVREFAAVELRDLDGEVDFSVVVEVVYDMATSDDPDERATGAAEFVVLYGSAAAHRLRRYRFGAPAGGWDEMLQDPDNWNRAAAVIMAAVSEDLPADAVLELLDDDEPIIRSAAIRAAATLGLADAAARIGSLAVNDPQRMVRMTALRTLPELPGQQGFDDLRSALTGPEPSERIAAAEALARLDDPRVRSTLMTQFDQEPDEGVRWELVAALVQDGGAMDPTLAQAIMAGLEDPRPARRADAVGLAGGSGLRQAAGILRTMTVEDPAERVRDRARSAFARVADLAELRDVVAAVPGEESRTMNLGILAHALLAHPADAVDELTAALTDGGIEWMVVPGISAMVRYDKETYEYVEDQGGDDADPESGLTDGEPATRWAALDRLSRRWSEDAALGTLSLAMLDPEPAIARKAAGDLDSLADDYTLESLDKVSTQLLRDSDRLSELIALLDRDDEFGRAAGWVLSLPVFLPDLLAALQAGQTAVRRVLWQVAHRHGLRLYLDGTAKLPSGRSVTWAELPALLTA